MTEGQRRNLLIQQDVYSQMLVHEQMEEGRALRSRRQALIWIVVWGLWGMGWTAYALYSPYASGFSWLTPVLTVVIVGTNVWMYLTLYPRMILDSREQQVRLRRSILNIHNELQAEEV